MIAIVYFGEMLVASLLAIVLLAISQLRMSSDAVLFAGGVVALPSFAVGTPWVQNDGLAMLHRGERVVTAADNAAGVGRGGDAHFHLGGLTINGSITPAELKSHIRTIAVGLKEHWQTNPTTRPAY
jgi:hypothetical protein